MNRSEIAKNVAEKLQLTKTDADNTVKAVIEAITQGLTSSGRVEIPGFGIFSVVCRKARRYRIPATGEMITVAERNVVVFKPAKAIRDAVR